MKIKLFILMLFAFVSSNCVNAQLKDPMMVKIVVDNISFEGNGMLKVFDDSNNEIVRFNRFENSNIQMMNIKNTNIFDEKNDLIMTVVINFEEKTLQLHLLNSDNKRGLIEMVSSVGFGSISTDVKIDYYNKNYAMKHVTKIRIGKVAIEKKLYLDDKLVISNSNKAAGNGGSKGNILVNKDYLSNNRQEAGIWAILFFMMNELGK